MRAAVDILLVSIAFGAACLYAFLKLAARAASSGACGGCEDCAPGADAEVRVPLSEIPRRR